MTRLELATFRVTGGRSNQLSYTPLWLAAKQYQASTALTTKMHAIGHRAWDFSSLPSGVLQSAREYLFFHTHDHCFP